MQKTSLLKEFKRSFSYTGIFLKTNIFGSFQSILKNKLITMLAQLKNVGKTLEKKN